MKTLFEALLTGFGFFIGLTLAIYIFALIFNGVEHYMLSQNCDKYFETLREANLVPHRCYKD